MVKYLERIGRSRVVPVVVGLTLVAAACGGTDDSETAAAQQDVVPIGASESSDAESATTETSVDGGSSEPDGPSDADAPTDTDAPSDGDGTTYTIAEAQDAYRSFVECMRDAGVPVAPAVFTADGTIDIDAEIEYFDSLTAEDAARFEELGDVDTEAIEEGCLPEGAEELYALIAPDESRVAELTAELEVDLAEQLTSIAQCMRRTFPDFPDPVLPDLEELNEDEGSDGDFNPFPGIDPEDPVYEGVVEACAQEIGLDIGTDGGADS